MKDWLKDVFCIVGAEEKFSAIDEVISKCTIFDSLPDKERFIRAVHRREEAQSTGIGHGVAIAHGKIYHLEKPCVALGLSEHGIIFDDRYPDPVKLIFVIASAQNRNSEYLRTVSAILTWVHDPEFRSLLVDGKWDDERVAAFLSMFRDQEFRAQY